HSVGVLHISEADTRSALLKRSALKRIQARSRTSSSCTPQSANSTLSTGSSSKQEKFMEESYLASDSVLVYYFNEFLRLPSFSEALVYNQESGLFEVVNGAAQLVSKRITTALKLNKNLLVSGDLAGFSSMPPPDNHYSVCVFGSNEEPVPVEQQSQLSECGAALKDGTDYLPLLDRGEAVLGSGTPN
ncbi:hypothetical protein GOODEAATRI_022138, partial [Goodea atripinnis]